MTTAVCRNRIVDDKNFKQNRLHKKRILQQSDSSSVDAPYLSMSQSKVM